MSVPWRDKAGIVHAWLVEEPRVANVRRDNTHAGWHTARAPCGASRRLRHGRDADDRPRDADVNCMNCLVRGESDKT